MIERQNKMARRRNSVITSLKFNQDQGCFTCCLTTGLRVYNVEPLVEKTHYSADELGEVTLCEMVSRSNWLLVVRARRPCTVMMIDDHSRKLYADVTFKTPIRAMKAKKDKVAVVLPNSVQVLLLPSLERIALLRTPHTPRPLCALAVNSSTPAQYIAAPAHRRGSLQLWDISRVVRGAQSSSPAMMACHKGALVCVALSSNGTRLATASDRGTMLRVWDTATRTLLHDLRRGSDYAEMYCINFNASASLVCCVSDKGTLHVWNLSRQQPVHLATGQTRPDTRALCGFLDDTTTVVICSDGTFHKFTYSVEGSCHRRDFEYFLQVGDDDDFIH